MAKIVLDKKGVKGSILIGILVSTLVAWGYAKFDPAYAASLGIYLPEGIFKQLLVVKGMRYLLMLELIV